MLEDEVCLGVCDGGMPGQIRQHEVTQIARAVGGNVKQIVVGAAHVKERENSGPRGRRSAERIHLASNVLDEFDRDEGLHRHAECRDIDVGVVSPHVAITVQAT